MEQDRTQLFHPPQPTASPRLCRARCLPPPGENGVGSSQTHGAASGFSVPFCKAFLVWLLFPTRIFPNSLARGAGSAREGGGGAPDIKQACVLSCKANCLPTPSRGLGSVTFRASAHRRQPARRGVQEVLRGRGLPSLPATLTLAPGTASAISCGHIFIKLVMEEKQKQEEKKKNPNPQTNPRFCIEKIMQIVFWAILMGLYQVSEQELKF